MSVQTERKGADTSVHHSKLGATRVAYKKGGFIDWISQGPFDCWTVYVPKTKEESDEKPQ